MEELVQLAKSVIGVGLRDTVTIYNGKDFKYNGQPFIDKDDLIMWSRIKPIHIDVTVLEWFESKSRAPFSYLYWMDYAGFNPNPIKCYIKKLRAILDGEHLQDEKKIEVDRWAEPEQRFTARGYLPYVRTHPHSRKWMNV